ncbi:energy-coupling factor transport system substrate-specific component [Weissella uvarum]|uniref:ECF-type riboflavin transporter substrate-binding protein n=1 Tax=Weissella uvarum TaxID=1479233 RepID=UPI001960C7FF|nr:ECF-type riboflavin transporter substrate-binding protein [Weissella uvarum]MBM7616480.1 energy-coupling factor transport system substrate-specific component [Weissella uvarum]MCM0595059.1 ECF-type riboflavin transporter substrate-binding protein [Weissella uvarum]
MKFLKKCGLVAVFAVLGALAYQFLSLPFAVPNTVISFEPAVLTLASFILGPIGTMGVGFLGHFLYDSLNYSIVWWTWIIAEGIYGLLLGLISLRLKLMARPFNVRQFFAFNLWQLLANLLAWGLIAPLGDFLIYKSDWIFVFQQGLFAALANTIVIAIFGSLFLFFYHYFFKS